MSEMNKWQERENAIVNGVMSGDNSCGAIQAMLESGKLEGFIRQRVRATLAVCADEERQLQQDFAAARQENTALRFAVESVIANQNVAPAGNPIVMKALRAAAPGHAFL